LHSCDCCLCHNVKYRVRGVFFKYVHRGGILAGVTWGSKYENGEKCKEKNVKEMGRKRKDKDKICLEKVK
jgi:hypothetical protein